jgi:hypothetical protein
MAPEAAVDLTRPQADEPKCSIGHLGGSRRCEHHLDGLHLPSPKHCRVFMID